MTGIDDNYYIYMHALSVYPRVYMVHLPYRATTEYLSQLG
jgi:hypothetical protein